MNTRPELLERSIAACDAGNYDLAISLGQKLIDLYDAPEGLYALGLVYAVKENWILTKKYCLETYKYLPEVPDNLNRLGVALCNLGEIEEGLKYFKKGIDLGAQYCMTNYNYWIKKI